MLKSQVSSLQGHAFGEMRGETFADQPQPSIALLYRHRHRLLSHAVCALCWNEAVPKSHRGEIT